MIEKITKPIGQTIEMRGSKKAAKLIVGILDDGTVVIGVSDIHGQEYLREFTPDDALYVATTIADSATRAQSLLQEKRKKL